MNGMLKTMILFAGLTALLLGIGTLIAGQTGLIIAFILSLIMNLVSWYASDKIALSMYRAQAADKTSYHREYEMLRRLSRKAGIPTPKLYIIPSSTPNAFATGRNPQNASVALTEGIRTILSAEELEGVIAHELAHVKNRDILIASIAATLAGVISYIATMAQWAAIFGGFGGNRDNNGGGNILSLLLLAILAPLIAMIIQFAISRSREYAADATGAGFMGRGEPLARALEKLDVTNKHHPMRGGNETSASLFIINPFSGRMFASLFSTHPPTSERIARLRR